MSETVKAEPSALEHYPPGSRAAGEAGCQCPVVDNGYGLGLFRNRETGKPVFVIVADCPLHGLQDALTLADCPF